MKKQIEISDRIFVFGGVYGNLQALDAAMEFAAAQGFAPDQMICTGDIVAYCGQPVECVEKIMASGIHCIQGNCEESLALGSLDCGCGFEEGSACDLLSAQWFAFCNRTLDDQHKDWMTALPKQLEIRFGGLNLLCFHGSPDQINAFVFASDIIHGRHVPVPAPRYDGFIAGHCGIPFVETQSDTFWLNSGALGMPANDGTQRVWVATIEQKSAGIELQTHALSYDHPGAAQAMEKAGLRNGYCDGLLTGMWPSLDVLPREEAAMTGQALEPDSKQFAVTVVQSPSAK